MASRGIVLPPATPSELLTHTISHYRYPSTLLIGTSKELFLQSCSQDIAAQSIYETPRHQRDHPDEEVREQDEEQEQSEKEDHDINHQQLQQHPLSKATLMQVAVSRHIHTVFIPTVVHLRAYLSVFSHDDSSTPAPPNPQPTATAGKQQQPVLLMYGFLELHRATSEWSAQGIANSASALVEAAARNGFRAVIVDPTGGGGYDNLKDMSHDEVPVLSGTAARDDGSWSGRTVEVRRIMGRWFEIPV
jgi:hypothetical protein